MKDITLVTTFHQPGLELYGQQFLNTFAEKVDKNISLIVYAEDCSPTNPDPEQITILDAKQVLPKLNAFKEKWKNEPKANGIPPPEIRARRPKDHHKAFKWDAVRFANKVYAVFDACTRSKDWCVWIDADTIVHSSWNHQDLSRLLPDDVWLTFVGRGKGSATWPECGFYGLNLHSETCKKFIAEFERYYEEAEKGIFKLPEWHDSYVFGHILNIFRQKDNRVLDYTSNTVLQTAKTGGGGHPLINTELGKWIDHLKGTRKHQGRSKKSDITVNRTEEYWRTV